jgi:hypothetical protein
MSSSKKDSCKELIALNTSYELFLEDKLKITNFLRRAFGDLDLIVKSTKIINLMDCVDSYCEKYTNILNKISREYSELKKS